MYYLAFRLERISVCWKATAYVSWYRARRSTHTYVMVLWRAAARAACNQRHGRTRPIRPQQGGPSLLSSRNSCHLSWSSLALRVDRKNIVVQDLRELVNDERTEIIVPSALASSERRMATAKYGLDWLKLYGAEPLCIMRPSTTAQVSKIAAYCNAHGVAIVPQGGNTGLVGGGVPDRVGQVVLSMERLNSIREWDEVCIRGRGAGNYPYGYLNVLEVHPKR